MAGVKVFINGSTVGGAVNTPGGPVWEMREKALRQLEIEFLRRAPVGKRNDARHRTEPVGRFKRGLHFERYGNQNGLGLRFENRADHAWYVEKGRSASFKRQRYSSVHHNPPGAIYVNKTRGTRARGGKYVMRNSVNTVMPRLVDGYTLLP